MHQIKLTPDLSAFYLYFPKVFVLIIQWQLNSFFETEQFAIFKRLSYCFEETIGFDAKLSFASRPVSRLIRWYNNQVI